MTPLCSCLSSPRETARIFDEMCHVTITCMLAVRNLLTYSHIRLQVVLQFSPRSRSQLRDRNTTRSPRNYPRHTAIPAPGRLSYMRNTWYRTRTYPRERQSYQRDEPSRPPMKLLLRGLSAIMVGLASGFGRAVFVDVADSICPACECDGAFCEYDGLGGGL